LGDSRANQAIFDRLRQEAAERRDAARSSDGPSTDRPRLPAVDAPRILPRSSDRPSGAPSDRQIFGDIPSRSGNIPGPADRGPPDRDNSDRGPAIRDRATTVPEIPGNKDLPGRDLPNRDLPGRDLPDRVLPGRNLPGIRDLPDRNPSDKGRGESSATPRGLPDRENLDRGPKDTDGSNRPGGSRIGNVPAGNHVEVIGNKAVPSIRRTIEKNGTVFSRGDRDPMDRNRPDADGRGPVDRDRSEAIDRAVELRKSFEQRLRTGELPRVAESTVGRKLDFARQFELQRTGDVARRLEHTSHRHGHDNWRHHRHHGPVAKFFVDIHFGHRYPGPRWYPSYCWYPRWSTWVHWTWWDYCDPFWDPRPIYCRPIIYHPAPIWVVHRYPDWRPLPYVASGTWVDVPVPEYRVESDVDVQLLAVRFVDPGHPERDLGPRYRVWFRNNGPRDLDRPFNVMLFAANGETLEEGLPHAGVRVESMENGQVQSVDIRLPAEANSLGRDVDGEAIPFARLHAVVDSHNELPDAARGNNGAVVARIDVLPVDPAAFSTDVPSAAAGSTIAIAGEGFGPEPGSVLISVKGVELEATIEGWYDLGVRLRLPTLRLAGQTQAELIVVRGDGAVSNPLPLTLTPEETGSAPPQPR
jgi:hypothetical protein